MPLILDLFCGAGGAAMGYHSAGFGVVGVDIAPQPNYPFSFVQRDALELLESLLNGGTFTTSCRNPNRRNDRPGFLHWTLDDFAAIHASPPCQHFTKYGNTVKDIKERYEDLLEPTRELLKETDLPYIIENVERAPLLNPLRLCGSMFDGHGTHDIQRHRLFEANFPLHAPGPCDHTIWTPDRYPGGRSVARGGHSKALVRKTMEIGSWDIPLATQKWGMGVDWDVGLRELSEAVPPVYTELVGRTLRVELSLRDSRRQYPEETDE